MQLGGRFGWDEMFTRGFDFWFGFVGWGGRLVWGRGSLIGDCCLVGGEGAVMLCKRGIIRVYYEILRLKIGRSYKIKI